MKSLRIITGIVLVALATAAAGQKSTFKERIYPSINQEVIFAHTDYTAECNETEVIAENMLSWYSPRVTRSYYELTDVLMYNNILASRADNERVPAVETWMVSAFENCLIETVPAVETWMVNSFENSLTETFPTAEGWMSAPFEESLSDELVYVETWMTEPFDNDLSEEPLIVEEWMLSPFEIGGV